jgi:hypothetical protein
MSKARIRTLIFASLIIGAIGGALIALGIMGSTFDQSRHVMTHLANPPLFVSGICVAVVASILMGIAWIGSILNTVRLREWKWLLIILLVRGLGLLIYSFVGPEPQR